MRPDINTEFDPTTLMGTEDFPDLPPFLDRRSGDPRPWETHALPDVTKHSRRTVKVDFAAINTAALALLPALLRRWLPGGRFEGHEYRALNPRRGDLRVGSFSINTRTGRWTDFATGDRGGDPVSLAAYLSGLSQAEAARELTRMLGLGDGR